MIDPRWCLFRFAGVAACCLLPAVTGCGDDGSGPGDTAADSSDDAGGEVLDGEEDAGAETDAEVEPDGDADAGSDVDGETGADADADTGDGGDGDVADVPPPINCSAIDRSVTVAGLVSHMEALEAIALAAGGNRAVGSPGWEATRDYVREQLEASGYDVVSAPIEYPHWADLGGHVLERTAPSARTYVYTDDPAVDGDFSFMGMSPPGDVTAPLVAVDLMLGPGNTSTSGCDAADFAGFPAGSIALVQRGACTLLDKAINADDAGAAGLLIFNQGDSADPGRTGPMVGFGLLPWVLSDADHGVGIPVATAAYAVGEELATLLESGPVTVHLLVDTEYEIRASENLTTETAVGNPDELVLFGAHLEGPGVGAGINSDATGIAALLEIARVVAECPLERKLGFALWGTLQLAPWGSGLHLAGLDAAERARLHSYFDMEMLGSPNYAVFVHDGDGSFYGLPGPSVSADIERFFSADMLMQALPTVEDLNAGNDTWSFVVNDIAAGALTTYRGGEKSEDEAAMFGGTAGESYDACFRTECDTVANIDPDITEILARSYARAAQFFGIDGLSVPPLP